MTSDSDYLDWEDRRRRAMELLSRSPVERQEVQSLDERTARESGIVQSDTEWLLLVNRTLADDRVRFYEERLVALKPDRSVREAISTMTGPNLKTVDLLAIAATVGRPADEVAAVARNVCDTALPHAWVTLDGPHHFVGNSRLEFDGSVRRGFQRSGFGPEPEYPDLPLAGIYQRAVGRTSGGANGRVTRHSTTRDTVWAKAGTPVAVKLTHEINLARANGTVARGIERLVREFECGFRAGGRSLAKTYDIVEARLPLASEGPEPIRWFGLVMEWLEGTTLEIKNLPGDPQGRIALSMQLAEAVEEMQGAGIVHRDLKPANAMSTTNRGVVILDFGFARGPWDADSMLTVTADLLGAPRYASPQQLLSATDEHPSDDIYMLGVCICEMVALEHPFANVSYGEIATIKKAGPANTVALERVAPSLAPLIRRMTSPLREDRPPISEVVAALGSS